MPRQLRRGVKLSEEIPICIADVQYNPDIINGSFPKILLSELFQISSYQYLGQIICGCLGLLLDLQFHVDAKCALITKGQLYPCTQFFLLSKYARNNFLELLETHTLLIADIEFMATSIRQAFHLELIKLPTQMKSMPVIKFSIEYGDNLGVMKR